MANVFDYLEWRGDLSFAQDGFHLVDNLILSELAYVAYDDVLSEGSEQSLTLGEVGRQYFALHPLSEVETFDYVTRRATQLMAKVYLTRRFETLRLSRYTNRISTNHDYQMAAVTFQLEDDSYYVAFRGTDDTIVGWKEDFMLAYKKETTGQLYAKWYLNHHFSQTQGIIRVGGHSKGGNFAMYAAAFCDPKVQNQIIKVYSNDGPGFLQAITSSMAFKSIKERCVHIIPENAMIGILLDVGIQPLIVASERKDFLSHDGMTWKVKGCDFVWSQQRSESSMVFDAMIRDWLIAIDEASREAFINQLFLFLNVTGKTTMTELRADGVHALIEMIKMMSDLSDAQKESFVRVLLKLPESYTRHVIDDLKNNRFHFKNEKKNEVMKHK